MMVIYPYLTIILILHPILVASLTCWTNFCDSEDDWCVQDCNSNEACFASFVSLYHNSTTPIIAGREYGCLTASPDDCLNIRCELSSSLSTLHVCCCREDLCNAVDNVVPGVTAPTQGPVVTPSGTPPMQMGDSIVCESFQPDEHIYKHCEICMATYELADEEYVLKTKSCLDSTPSPSSSCQDRCLLDTSGSSDQVTCCCTDYLCNAQSMLLFTDVTRVSDYVHTSVCDGSNCSHSCVVINQLPRCICSNGFAIHENGIGCVDVNECLMSPSPCDQVCVNTDGSYMCSCVDGYRLLDNGTCTDAGLICGHQTSTTIRPGIIYCNDVLEDLPPEERQDNHPSCQALYSRRGDTFVPAHLSCFPNQEQSHENCLQPECVLNSRANSEFYQCCCNVSFCNLNVVRPPNETLVMNPVTTEEVQSTEPGTLSSGSKIGLMVAGLIVAILIICVVCVLSILCCWSKCCHRNSSLLEEGAIVYHGQNPSYNMSEDVSLSDEIGRGRFSKVYLGQRNGSSVAVKCFEDKESFTKEVSIYRTEGLQHENVLKYLDSIQIQEEKRWWIVFEYHSRGSLYAVLTKTTVTHKEFVILAESTASGLAFLHHQTTARNKTIKPCVVHRDLKSKNILVKSNGQCAISDFGLSIKFPLSDEQEGHGQVGTSRYMAPEVLEGSIFFDRKSYKQIDCYSLGVIFYEILTRTKASGEPVPPYLPPFSERVPQQPGIEEMKEAVVKCHYRPAIPDRFIKDESFDRITETIYELWDSVPDARLTAEATSERMKLYRLETFDEKTTDSGLDIEVSTPTSHTSSTMMSPPPFSTKDLGYSASSYTAETTV